MNTTQFTSGEWNAICDRCGFQFKASELRRDWQGFMVDKKCYESRHPQDFIKLTQERVGLPWSRPEGCEDENTTKDFCYLEEKQALPNIGVASCMVASEVNSLFSSGWGSVEDGTSGTIVTPIYGDHPAGDGLTRLQTAFADGTSTDISEYLIGPGVMVGTGSSVVAGKYTAIISPIDLETNTLIWTNSGLERQANGVGQTIEFFVNIIEMTVGASSARDFFFSNVTDYSGAAASFSFYVSGGATRDILFNWPTVASAGYGIGAFGLHHIAIVTLPDNTMRFYIDGALIAGPIAVAREFINPATTYMQLGGSGGYSQQTKFEFSGIRVRNQAMYDTGATGSFTPPANPAAWGLP